MNAGYLPPEFHYPKFLFPLFQKLFMADSPSSSQIVQNHPKNGHIQQKFINPAPFQPPIEIQAANKKKQEIINLQSSEEKDISKNQESPKKTGSLQSTQDKKIKMKKITPKCQLCKGGGKKNQMKICVNCKLFFHINCLEENEVKKKYVCDRCRIDKGHQSKFTKKQKKLEEKNQQIDKTTLKKLQKEKKKDQCNRILKIFNQKYPYYVGDDGKIKFPIEDKLLFIYREYFEPSESKLIPIDHPIIPSQYLGDFLEIQNFLTSFRDEIQYVYNGQTRKSTLFLLMNCEGSDKSFEELIIALIRIYLKDIFEKNKTENVKTLNDHSFFIILGNLIETNQLSSQYFASIAPEIIRYLSSVPSMKKAFQNFQFPSTLNLQKKLKIILSLLQGLSEVDAFHDMVSRKSQKMSQMTKQKANLISKLKKDEAQALSNKEKFKSIMANIADKQANGNLNEDPKYLKQIEKNKKKTAKMTNQREQIEIVIKDFKEKIVKIAKMIPFAISQIMLLGNDRNKSQYFFFLQEPNRIYVRYHNFLLDDNASYKIYEGKQKIVELLKSLNAKGINEKHLHENINMLVKEEIIRNLTSQEQNAKKSTMCLQSPTGFAKYNDENFKNKIIDDVLDMEESFSNYLAIKSCQWASPAHREEFRFGFAYICDVQAFKENIKSLQQHFLFVESIKEREVYREDRDFSDSNNEDKDFVIIEKELSRRKKPIRLWGMNAEKIRKYWAQYLQMSINYTGIWICVNLLRSYVKRYLQKKLQALKEQEKKQRQKQLQEYENQLVVEIQQIQREDKRTKQKEESLSKERSNQKKLSSRRNREVSYAQIYELSDEQQEQEKQRKREGKRTGLRKSTRVRNKILTIDSDDEEQSEESKQDSNNEEQCEICGEFGDMICCDTCPKVFHIECLKLKEVPEGQWNCIACLERLSNTRQTRSRMRKLNQ